MTEKISKHISSSDSAKVLTTPIIKALKDTTTVPSLFQNHLLPDKNTRQQIHITDYDYWVSGILLALYVLFVWMYVSNRKKLNQVIKGFYISRFSNQLSREEFSVGNRVSVFLSIFFVFTLTLFFIRIIQYYGFHFFTDNVALLGLIIALIIIIAYSIKFSIIKFLGNIFQLQKEANDYMMIIFLFCNTLGLVMLPLVICLTFLKQVPPVVFIYIGIFIITLFVFVRIFRGLILGLNSSGISKLYLFLYLCTLEIVPFIILVKLFMLFV